MIKEEKRQKIKYFLLKYICLNLIIINKLKSNKNEFNIWFNEIKKFNSNAKKDITIKPKISCKEKDLRLVPFWNNKPYGVYKKVTKKLNMRICNI